MKARTRRVISATLLITLAVAIILATSARLFQYRELQRRQSEERANTSPRALVSAVIVPRDFSRERRLLVRLEPWRESQLASEISGIIREIRGEPGLVFKKGDVIAKIDDTLPRAERDAALVELQEAERLLREAQELGAQRVVSATELAARKAAAEAARARVALLNARIEKTEIRAPYDGAVRSRRVQLGESVNPGQPIVDYIEISPLRGVLQVTDEELSAFQIGEKIQLQITTNRLVHLEGIVSYIAPGADPATRLHQVELRIPQPVENPIPAGTLAESRVKISRWQGVPAVPEAAVRWRGNTATVELISGGEANPTVEQATVQLGPLINGYYPVLEGLSSGDRVILR